MKNIVVIDHEPLTVRRQEIFYIEELRAAGFNVKFWDCSQYFHRGMVITDSVSTDYLLQFDNLAQIEAALQDINIKNTIFIVETFGLWKNREFFRLLAQNGCFMVRQEMYATATLGDVSDFQKLVRASPIKLCKVVRNRINGWRYKQYCKKYGIAYSLKISSGNAHDINVHINHPDWERAHQVNTGKSIIDGRYALFIDEFFPLHPDMFFFEGRKSGDAVHYQDVMCRFFDAIEKQYNIEVIIASHPKADYGQGCFNGRKIIKYRTAELIAHAEMIFMHSSAAISYVMIYDRPLALIVTDAYEHVRSQYINMLRISKMTRLPIYNIEQNQVVECRAIEPKIRESYLYSYLTSKGIENTKNADILINTFTHP